MRGIVPFLDLPTGQVRLRECRHVRVGVVSFVSIACASSRMHEHLANLCRKKRAKNRSITSIFYRQSLIIGIAIKRRRSAPFSIAIAEFYSESILQNLQCNYRMSNPRFRQILSPPFLDTFGHDHAVLSQ